MNKEDFIIKAFLNEKNGDDGALLMIGVLVRICFLKMCILKESGLA